jgi:hypothetical protein
MRKKSTIGGTRKKIGTNEKTKKSKNGWMDGWMDS